MRKSFKLQDLDCANCARKMQDAAAKIDGVNSISITFMTQKMVLDADTERYDEILDKVQAVCSKVEPDCVILR